MLSQVKEKTFTLTFTEDQMNLLFMGLRYLELHHAGRNLKKDSLQKDYRPDFHKLLNEIVYQVKQLSLF